MRFEKAETLFVEGGDGVDDAVRAADNADARRRRRPPPPPRRRQPAPPPKLDASNPGYSMLRSMGWSEANPGLGKTGQGRSEPVRAEPRRARAGLGAAAAAAEGRGQGQGEPPPPPPKEREKRQEEPPEVDPAIAAARARGAALVRELLSRDLCDFGRGGGGASQRALNPLLDPEGAPARRHWRRNPLLSATMYGEKEGGNVK